MKNTSKIHSASVQAFIEYLKRSQLIRFSVLVKRMYYHIGWPVDTIVYVIAQLNEAGFTYPASRLAIQNVLRK